VPQLHVAPFGHAPDPDEVEMSCAYAGPAVSETSARVPRPSANEPDLFIMVHDLRLPRMPHLCRGLGSVEINRRSRAS